ncbi:hypothetical protein HGRIS_009561 [Hohenbuehelia grisea]|uniref:Uncharacterized protein n=1 Tax=Hohenbuehelia grisea TaxID=104357 RepID=A0ABR3J1P2_9AGAR
MEGPSASDLERLSARIADPSTDLRTKHVTALEIQDMLDTVRESESGRILPHLIPSILDLLRSTEASFQKDATEHNFRRVLLEILHRLPANDSLRPHAVPVLNCMLHVIRHDNDENSVTCCKIMVDFVRAYRALSEEILNDFMAIFQQNLTALQPLTTELLSADSVVMDTNTMLPGTRSFKVFAEMAMAIVIFMQVNKPLCTPAIQTTMSPALDVLRLEAPAQKRARDDFEAMGGFWAGMAPTIKNHQAYNEFINVQIKMVSYMAYIMRWGGEQYASYGEPVIGVALRILQDCPEHGITMRKDLMVVFRHLMATSHRRALLNQLDKLFDERVLLGTAVSSKELLRASVYSAVADLVHHLRNELTVPQLQRTVDVFSRLMHNPSLGGQFHTLCAKMLFNIIEPVHTKETPQGAVRLLNFLFETCLERLDSLTIAQVQISAIQEAKKENRDPPDFSVIEKARPIGGILPLIEKPEEVIPECRLIFRALLHGFRVCLGALRKFDDSSPDGTLIARLFEGCIRCMALFDPDPRLSDQSDAIDWVAPVLVEINMHVFQEVWTQKIDFFFNCAQKRIFLLNICSFLLNRDATSPTLLAIILRYLVDKLPLLGDYDDHTAAATIRLFKLAFNAVGAHPATNEPILASHLAKLLMDCFPLAAKASKPTHYLHLLRALFRAIGGGGGRFELLYKEVLPLLPDMLENLNKQLLASEGQTQDMIVELCLTVPLRLTHLLPHLTYLMQPLALALKGSPELVSQGLRTLELCIDNLTPDFLDPTLDIVLRELMEALHGHLKPLPANHLPAHTTIRILGKLGGRNRKLLTREPLLSYSHHSERAHIGISFNGISQKMDLEAVAKLAVATISKPNAQDRQHAFLFLENCLVCLLHEGVKDKNIQETFVRMLEGLYDAVHIPELSTQSEQLLRQLAKSIFETEVRHMQHRQQRVRLGATPLFESFLRSIPHGLTYEKPEQVIKARAIMGLLVQDLSELPTKHQNITPEDVIPLLHQVASRFTALCLEDSWASKSAGCAGIHIITCTLALGAKWIADREVDFVRTLLHVLKDLPVELPRDPSEVFDVLGDVLRVSNSTLDFQGPGAEAAVKKIVGTVSIFTSALQSPNTVVRKAAATCIGLLGDISGRPLTELLLPYRDRTLNGIYTKPLRALPYPIQIGMIEAIRYYCTAEPPLVEVTDEFLRLLHETLALADADDGMLLNRSNLRQSASEITRLRVACIKLLTAAMPLTDFFSKQNQTRSRVTSVYFKSLYSDSPEIKEVAHEGLRVVLVHQSRLPKELLQTGLRPVLMNLADPKRLSVAGLEGLARLLELLTNYFKVEIGHKLLDHFRSVADPQMLQASSKLPLAENDNIAKLYRLANIFHLLPAAANIFLKDLINAIVQAETQLHCSGRSPFSEPLAKYLDRYPIEGIEFFMRHLHFARHLRTLRSIIQAKLAPHLETELASQTSYIVTHCLHGTDKALAYPALLLFQDLCEARPTWLGENGFVLDALVELWRADPPSGDLPSAVVRDVNQRDMIILAILMKAIETSSRVDLLFEIIHVFTKNWAIDLIRVVDFLYQHVAMSPDLAYKRNVFMRFITWSAGPSRSWSDRATFIRYMITPTLLVHANHSPESKGLVTLDYVNAMHRTIWHPNATSQNVDDAVKMELLHFTTVLVQHYAEFLEDAKKDIIKWAWQYITTAEDPILKQTAYLLTARFFAAFPTPQKFIIRAWTGLLRPPLTDGKTSIRQEALAALVPSLPKTEPGDQSFPQWALTTRRLLTEEGIAQILVVYSLIAKHPQLFFSVRQLFIPHIVNSLSKLGLSSTSSPEYRSLTIDVLQIIYDWEKQAHEESDAMDTDDKPSPKPWFTPLGYRENMVSYLVRLGMVNDASSKALVPRALSLLQAMVSPGAWSDVTVGLRFFMRSLEQNELNNEQTLAQALATAKILHVIAVDQTDAWYTANAALLHKLVRKGMLTDDHSLQDALAPVFEHLLKLFPLPKEEEDQQGDMSEFHNFIYSAINDGLRNGTTPRGVLLMLNAVVKAGPERIETFGAPLMKLLGKFAKDHFTANPTAPGYEANVRLQTAILDICVLTVAFLGEQRRALLTTLLALVERSKSPIMCRYLLDLARTWAFKPEPYPTLKEKASLLQKMVILEHRFEPQNPIYHQYLELIFDIYSEPNLRRSDLTSRLEGPYLSGCHATDTALRERFIDLLDMSVPRSLFSRLTYILGVQGWQALAEYNWIYLASHLLLGSIDNDSSARALPPTEGTAFLRTKTQSIVRPLQRLLCLDPQVAHDTWVSIFPAAWTCLSRREQAEVTQHMISLLSKDYHIRQADVRPNVIQTLLTGINACDPPMILPPHLVKYLAKAYGAWHIGLEILGSSFDHVRDDEVTVRDHLFDSLADIYAELAEDDLFYGVWRRRCLHNETNVAISLEQTGMWEQAALAYENAQSKARNGTIPFVEVEYCLWEDHWMLAAEKLQQWDILYDLGRNDSNHELVLESAWRTQDWADQREFLEGEISQLPEVPTPRRRVFEAFLKLLKPPNGTDNKNVDFVKILEDAMQLTLRKWVGLPPHLSPAHVPLLQHFQQFVELQEAVQIFASLAATNAQNLEKKSQELKMVLQAWRERLPNIHDDISIWSDLVAWRQNVFQSINKAYLPLLSTTTPTANGNSSSANTFGYRGYHETAWIINRFAHVARKHDLLDVCFTSLTKIYTLPNIEITEAFLKLREQARCHYQKPGDSQAGLEVINNTNLLYFSGNQKAEFYTLKGMFHARFDRNDDANQAFGQAVQLDMNQPKAWAEWGKYNDRLFKEVPNDMTPAANAVSCYLQAAGIYKSYKSRPLLGRVLWLLSIDDPSLAISKAFDTYKGDAAIWFWISLVPQLCLSITMRETKQARYLLLNIAKHYPQSVFFHVRAAREEIMTSKKLAAMRAQYAQNVSAASEVKREQSANGESSKNDQPNGDAAQPDTQRPAVPPVLSGMEPITVPSRQACEYVEEVVQTLKTSFPLLVLTMETVVDQVLTKFKCSADEDLYRHLCMLLSDAVQNFLLRVNNPDDDGKMNPQTFTHLARLSQGITGPVKNDYTTDFLNGRLTHDEYIATLQRWRDRYESILDARPRMQPLDALSHYLTEFQYSKVDDIEVPGQYNEDKDSNQNFVRIQKFAPKFENSRNSTTAWKRFTVLGSDNTKVSFTVQLPCGRFARREERAAQLLRTFNGALARKKETRKRNLSFHLPAAVPLSPQARLYQTDSSYISFGDIYDLHCADSGFAREDPILTSGERVRRVLREHKRANVKTVGFMSRGFLLSCSMFLPVTKDGLLELEARSIRRGHHEVGSCGCAHQGRRYSSSIMSRILLTFMRSI